MSISLIQTFQQTSWISQSLLDAVATLTLGRFGNRSISSLGGRCSILYGTRRLTASKLDAPTRGASLIALAEYLEEKSSRWIGMLRRTLEIGYYPSVGYSALGPPTRLQQLEPIIQLPQA